MKRKACGEPNPQLTHILMHQQSQFRPIAFCLAFSENEDSIALAFKSIVDTFDMMYIDEDLQAMLEATERLTVHPDCYLGDRNPALKNGFEMVFGDPEDERWDDETEDQPPVAPTLPKPTLATCWSHSWHPRRPAHHRHHPRHL